MSDGKSRSPWAYVGVGCTVAAFALLAAIVGFGWWVFQSVNKIQVDMNDPSAREARVQSLLGCPRIPEGYHASLAISIPFLMDMVILGDREPVFGKDSRLFEKRGFVYVKMLRRGKSGASVQDFFDGKARVEQLIPGAGVEISEGEEIVRGTLARSDVSIRYLSRRGTIKTRGQSMSGITTFLVFECPGDARSRVGIWFGPEAAPDKGDDPSTGRTGAPGGAPPLAGTPADENAIREFTSHFSPCAS